MDQKINGNKTIRNKTSRNKTSRNRVDSNKRSNSMTSHKSANNRRPNMATKKKKKSLFSTIIKFVVYQVVFGIIIAPVMLLYGPFENAKSRFVGTAMNSMHYQFLATTFLSQEKIDKILGKAEIDESAQVQDDNLVSVPTKNDNTIKCELLENNKNFIGHVLTITDPRRIHIGYTSKLNDANKVGETTSQIAISNNAIAAINGGAFTDESNSQQWTANGGTPSGVIVRDGKVMYDDLNGKKSGMIAMSKGKLIIGKYSLKELQTLGATEAVSYNTTLLVSKGNMTPMNGDGGAGSSPVTLIGQRKDGSIILVVLDSKIEGSRINGATLKEAQEVMYKLKCVTAGTLDGGKSATMFYKDDVINNPSYAYGERSIPTAIIVK